MAEYSRIAKGHIIATGGTVAVNLPFQPARVEWWDYTTYASGASPVDSTIIDGYWDVSMGQGAAIYNWYNGSGAYATAATTTGGISTFSAGLSLQYGPVQQVIASTKGTTTSFNVSAHGYAVGDVVVFVGLYQSSTTGMPQMSGMPFVVTTVTDANNFIVNWNSNNADYTNLSGSPAGAYVKKVLYPFLYAPGVSFIKAITTGTTTTITTTAPHNLSVGSEVAFAIPAAWGTTQLDSYIPGSVTIPGSPIYGYVVSVTNSTTVVVNINSTGFTAFTTAVTVAQVKAGISFPQMIAVGDVNTGGVQISSGSALYPPPVVNGSNTINGPAIQGAFVNNTSQGFTFGSVIAPTVSDVIYFAAYRDDYALN